MSVQIILVSVMAALATVLVYLVVGRVLPGHWRKSEVEASEDFALDPANAREQSLQDKAIDKIQEVYDARRTRVNLINAGIPDFLWYTLIGGAVLVVLFPLLTKPHLTGRLLIAVGIQGAVIAGALYLVAVLNHPYSGAYRVEPSAFHILMGRFNASP